MTDLMLLGVGDRAAAAAAAVITTGYFSGGNTGVYVTTVNGLTFSTDTTAQVTKGALTKTTESTGGANSDTIGYTSGGRTSGGTQTAGTDGLTFSTDTTGQVTKGALDSARSQAVGTNSTTLAYWAGGLIGANETTETNGLTFSTDTTTMVTKGALVTARRELGATNSSTIGYYAGGRTGGAVTTVDSNNGLTFSTDTTATVTKGLLATVKNRFGGTANSSTIGYWAGGNTGNDSTQVTTNHGLTFSTDTTTMVTKGALTVARTNFSGSGCNSDTQGYFAGGTTDNTQSNLVDTNDGLTFSTDTTAMVSKGILTAATNNMAAFQNGGQV